MQHREKNYLPISHIITCLVSSSRFFVVYSCSQLACAGTSIFTALLKIMTYKYKVMSGTLEKHSLQCTSLMKYITQANLPV